MSELKVDKISPETATSLTVGTSGDTVTVPSGATLDVSNATVNLPTTLTVASELKTNKISPASGTTFTMGDSGDTFTIPSGVTFANSGTATGFGGALTKISSSTFTNATSVSFTTGIDSTYDVYIFKLINIHNDVDGDNFAFNCSIDGGSNYNVTKTTTFFRAQHYENDGRAALEYLTNRDRAQSTAAQWLAESMGNAASKCLGGELYLFSPSNTTYVKHFYATTVDRSNNDYCNNSYIGGYFNTTTAINAISFFSDGGSPAIDGTIEMWGL